MIDHGQRQRVGRLVGAALAESARLVTGGRPVSGPGFFYEPAVLVGVSREAAVARRPSYSDPSPL
jgi:succinate-semialdehyde dehydrogenase/glutarate-semialdehyde dehydrogenase/succinate-semialdehyde dehydrogenase